ncbi:hypothetical protein FQN55_005945 [Onygenales sp. PD_40]|nr:hypothetical protein FQN55_005945 [Onygenales sp. PD_40]KAK2791948.1 hypothetical protein FQN52_004390 [Onygenales sp. PD_12]KAK2801054.1 hypothetical protein FQN51_005618 [Onygenales sp. PD_10]
MQQQVRALSDSGPSDISYLSDALDMSDKSDKSGKSAYARQLDKRLSQPLDALFDPKPIPATRTERDAATMTSRFRDIINDPYPVQDPPHHLHVYSHKHNTHMTLTKPNREPLLSLSCGNIGFRKAHRSKFDAAHQLSSFMIGKIQEDGHLMTIKRLEVVLRGFGAGREAFTKVLLGPEGKYLREVVTRVTDSTRVKFGGTKSRNVRRLG